MVRSCDPEVSPLTITTGARVTGPRLAGVFLIVAVVWAVSLIAAPYLTTHHSAQRSSLRTAALVYVLGSIVCHQLPARSFHTWGVQLPVCTRCVGLYASAPFGAALALVWGTGRSRRVRFPMADATWLRAVLVVAALPTLVTWAGEWAGLMEVPGWIRTAAAAPLGVAVSWIAGLTFRGDLR